MHIIWVVDKEFGYTMVASPWTDLAAQFYVKNSATELRDFGLGKGRIFVCKEPRGGSLVGEDAT